MIRALAIAAALGAVILSESFAYPFILTNEYAYWNPQDAAAHRTPLWEMTSGTLYVRNGWGWTGKPDAISSGGSTRESSPLNNSAIFRLTTKEADFGDVSVAFSLKVNGLTSTTRTPAVDWDGVHVFLRYQSEYSLYYASVSRRDGRMVIKKKVPGGPSNGGTYYELTPEILRPMSKGVVHSVLCTVRNIGEAVQITASVDGVLVLQALDDGATGGAPILTPGKVGIRADNADMEFDAFKVTAI